MLDLACLLRIPYVDTGTKIDVSPDGERLAFAWNKTGRWEIYEMPLVDSGSHQPVSTGSGARFSPRYSPDGSSLAYVLDSDGSESYHVILYDMKNLQGKDLTPDIGYAHQPNYAWSPDSRHLAVLSDEHGQFSLYLLSIADGTRRLLLDVNRPIWDVTWSPDGRWIAVEVEWIANDRSLFLVNAENGDHRQLVTAGEVLNVQNPAWAPDSKSLLFSGENGEWFEIGSYDLSTREISWLTKNLTDDTQPTFSPDGEYIAWIHAEGAQTSLEVRKGNGETNRYRVGVGVHHWPKFIPGGIVCIYEDPTHPPDIWRLDLIDGVFMQLTKSQTDQLCGEVFVQPQEIRYPGMDGTEVPAILYTPDDAGAHSPAVVNIHGGPNWHYQYIWHPIMSHYASRGWTVLAPNYRGSTGYGRKWRNASRYDMGGVDTDDCAAGIKYLVENRIADRNNIAVTGSSHGGFLTMSCMTEYPELWMAGSAVVPFLNWIKSHYESRGDLQHWNIENMGDPDENRELWIERSPYFKLDRVTAPVQMICGANDPRCPASDSIDARDKLVELGKPVDLLVYEGEGHGFLDTEILIESELRRSDFLSKALDGGE